MTPSYISTRTMQGAEFGHSFDEILLKGLADDGGLFVPKQWPVINSTATSASLAYTAMAEEILSLFTGESFAREELRRIINQTYSPQNFRDEAITPLQKIGDSTYLMELFHGPTLAFKDLALQLLGRLFDTVLARSQQKIHILGATSGDTGSAAIEACRNRANITITILHPHGRTSEIQRRQMTSIMDDNVHNIAIEGSFDDCQNLVKQAFADEDLKRRKHISAINSINWARIAAQIVYYVVAARRLGSSLGNVGAKTAFAVPTGNFGNVYAAWAARKMGAAIGPLIIGSNRNDILTRFFETGEMKLHEVTPSLSPSMDIQISSNFERYLFECLDRDAAQLRSLMMQFRSGGSFRLPDHLWQKSRREFYALRCSDEDTIATIRNLYDSTGVIIDPHTAVGLHALTHSPISNPQHGDYFAGPKVAMACAHPAKFPDVVERAIGVRPALPDFLSDLLERREKYTVLPNDYEALKKLI